ncbi:hypothetical protein D3C80_2007670 [compost metagenome]
MCRSKLLLAVAQTSRGPSIQGFGWRRRFHSKASSTPAGSNPDSQYQSTGCGVGAEVVGSPQLNKAGISKTTSNRRRLWAAATCAAWA